MIDRLVSYSFTFLLLFFAVVLASEQDQQRIIIALGLAIAIVGLALFLNFLTVDGAGSAIVIGTVSFGLGGWIGAYAILFFFIGTHIVTRILYRKESPDFLEKRYSDRRNGSQVWSNGFLFTALLFIWYFTKMDLWLFVAMGALATSLSDTWASEVGESLSSGNARMITTFKKVPAGTDGGISLQGTLFGFFGAFLFTVGFLFLYGQPLNWTLLLAISIGGFSGCIADSYLGALFQNKCEDSDSRYSLSNNNVNTISTVIGAAVTFGILISTIHGLV